MVENNTTLNIVVTGDVVMDWNLARTCMAPDPVDRWKTSLRTQASWLRGWVAPLSVLTAENTKNFDFTSCLVGFENILGTDLGGEPE